MKCPLLVKEIFDVGIEHETIVSRETWRFQSMQFGEESGHDYGLTMWKCFKWALNKLILTLNVFLKICIF